MLFLQKIIQFDSSLVSVYSPLVSLILAIKVRMGEVLSSAMLSCETISRAVRTSVVSLSPMGTKFQIMARSPGILVIKEFLDTNFTFSLLRKLRKPLPPTPFPAKLNSSGRRGEVFMTSSVKLDNNTPEKLKICELKLSRSKILVGSEELTIILPESEDEVIDMYIEQGREDRDPYWCRLWPSAVLMAQEIFKNPKLVAGKRVCDLGSGLGLPGLAAAICGAKEVVFCDREPLALACGLFSVHVNIPRIRSNLHRLFPEFSSLSQDLNSNSATVPESIPCHLMSRISNQDSIVEPNSEPPKSQVSCVVEAQVFDWAEKDISFPEFDVVLACDVLYESPAVDLISDLIPRLLKKTPGTKLIVSDPVERVPENRSRFIQIMLAKDKNAKEMKLKVMSKRSLTVDNFEYNVQFIIFEG